MNIALPILFSALSVGTASALKSRTSSPGGRSVLSGLLLGFGTAFATGNENIIRYGWMIAAFGAIGMFAVRDLEPVPENDPSSSRMFGTLLKGFLRFAISSGFAATGAMVLGMVSYTLADIVLLFLLILLSRPLGILIFNRGKNNLRLSSDKKESWGKDLLLFAALSCVFIVKGNLFSLALAVTCGLFGAVGGLLSRLFFRTVKNTLSAFFSGAVGGAGAAVGTAVADLIFPGILSSGWFVSNGAFSSYIPMEASLGLGIAWGLLWAACSLLLRIRAPKRPIVSEWTADAVFCALPFLFITLGSFHTACMAAIPMNLFFTANEHTPTPFPKRPTVSPIILWSCFAVTAVLTLISTTAVPMFLLPFFPLVLRLADTLFPQIKAPRSAKKSVFPLILLPAATFLSAVLWLLII